MTRPGRYNSYSSQYQRIAKAMRAGLSTCVVDNVMADDDGVYPSGQTIENVQPVASYSWLKADAPTILVPSRPPTWSPPNLPFRCNPDQNDGKKKEYRLPVEDSMIGYIESVRYHQPDYRFDSIDIVTERNSLRKLLRWAQGGNDEFRIDIERAGTHSVLLMVWRGVEFENPGATYGHSFEASTVWPDDPNFLQHERIVEYDFAGLKFLVRFEVDACCTPTSDVDPHVAEYLFPSENPNRPDSNSPREPVRSNGLVILPSENPILVPQSDLMELKSLRDGYRTKWAWVYPQLYLSGTTHLMTGFHSEGIFHSMERFDDENPLHISMRVARCVMQPGLNKLAAVLRELHARVLEMEDDEPMEGRKLSLVCEWGARLALYERTGGARVPDSLLACFDA